MAHTISAKLKEEMIKQGIELSPVEMKQLEELLSKCDSISEDELTKVSGGALSPKMKKVLKIASAIGIGALAIGGGAYALNNYKNKQKSTPSSITPNPTLTNSPQIPINNADDTDADIDELVKIIFKKQN